MVQGKHSVVKPSVPPGPEALPPPPTPAPAERTGLGSLGRRQKRSEDFGQSWLNEMTCNDMSNLGRRVQRQVEGWGCGGGGGHLPAASPVPVSCCGVALRHGPSREGRRCVSQIWVRVLALPAKPRDLKHVISLLGPGLPHPPRAEMV